MAGDEGVIPMEAREIMTQDVLTLPPDLSVRDAVEQLLHYRIHGAPVVDRSGQLVGMVSFVDLAARSTGLVRDVMNPDPVTASEDTPVDDIAALMLDEMVRRIPIVEAGRVVGIVSASDIIQVFLNLHEGVRPAAAEKPAKKMPAAR
jgi:acetoin utilization protein AcuB